MFMFAVAMIILYYIHLNYLLFLFDIMKWKKYAKTKGSLPKISVIIAARDDETVIENTLKRLKASYPRKKLDIVVVDYSRDNTAKIARKYARVFTAKKPGRASALNLGVQKSRNDIIYFLDSDSLVEKDTIKMLVSGGEAVAGISLPINKGSFSERIGRLGAASFNALEISIEGLLKTVLFPGKNVMVRKDILNKVGGFSESLTEDLNFSMKLYMAGQKIKLLPAYCHELVPYKISHYWRQQEKWRLGTADEIKHYIRYLSLLELVVFLPYLVIRAMIAPVSVIFMVLFFLFPNYILLSGMLLGIIIMFVACVRFLDKDDLLLFPFLFLIYGVIDLMLLLNTLFKFNRERKWYRTPKQGYGPSKPHLEQT
ncbi:MAG: glycosyltransferase family 2 protein [Candidatus Aenigmarchaeota archaeon]|nr:glycosyltransferase family 2 protein [Candidatus Aenigmarchaeota archaeon]